MARPRSPETDEIVRLLGTKMSVRAVAAQLGMAEDTVKNAYYRHYDEVVKLQKDAERREKAAEIKAKMDEAKAGKHGGKLKHVNESPESVIKPAETVNEKPESVIKPAETVNERPESANEAMIVVSAAGDAGAVMERARAMFMKSQAAPLPEGATELIHSDPDAGMAAESAAEKDAAAVAEPVPEEEPEPARDAQGWLEEAMRKAAGELGQRIKAKARERFDEARAAAFPKRMKVAGYVGQGGRTYMLRDGGVQILGMTRTDYTTQEIRELADDLIELLGILDGEVIGA